MSMSGTGGIVVTISSGTEWRCLKELLNPPAVEATPFGEAFSRSIEGELVKFCRGGWGKVDAAASAQYFVSQWNPALLVNLGTCGGIEGVVEKEAIFFIERTIIYDIFERMSDPDAAIQHYQTDLDTSWLNRNDLKGISPGVILSGDRDLAPQDIGWLREKFDARILDWESGSIARVCKLNNVPCLIIRGVSDLVNSKSGEAYDGGKHIFAETTKILFPRLLAALRSAIKSFRKTSKARD